MSHFFPKSIWLWQIFIGNFSYSFFWKQNKTNQVAIFLIFHFVMDFKWHVVVSYQTKLCHGRLANIYGGNFWIILVGHIVLGGGPRVVLWPPVAHPCPKWLEGHRFPTSAQSSGSLQRSFIQKLGHKCVTGGKNSGMLVTLFTHAQNPGKFPKLSCAGGGLKPIHASCFKP